VAGLIKIRLQIQLVTATTSPVNKKIAIGQFKGMAIDSMPGFPVLKSIITGG